MSQETHHNLHQELEAALHKLEKSVGDADIQSLIEQVIESLSTTKYTNTKVFDKLTSLSNYITETRKEISAIRADAISGQHIPTATDQLDEVVGATEEATNKIMDCCDAISTLASEAPAELQGKLADQVTKIYEACNFQDITGQRITKVVRTLKHIEGQITSLVGTLEQLGFKVDMAGPDDIQLSKATDTEKHLLNGPQMTGEAIKQDDIDKLFG